MEETAYEFLEKIKNMEPAERWKLLDLMYDLYFNKGIQILDEGDEY
ncbi:hypothetical protein NRS6186_22290 (plasmid) [Bacillus subtilis]|uniref:Uncharacterized protein n=1 Tax=Bacillus subtilis subsp. natto TaxID=86029 RepID=E9RJH8_BACNA|nr:MULTISPECIES: hypothetical protein [Bacillus]MBA4562844.1 hypothetical protein [Bacillus subtilis subsp. subtilis]MBF8228422.1 hypothetical protein [Bacillus subtilis]MCF7615612.1 hypothetical protein [Bacillus subtilis]MCM3386118.1 hypothetical protein [Bacillus subtilis]MDD9768002.1 hypothetical protein [Bacillus subtilis]